MKGIYYVAAVIRAYRTALDALKNEGDDYRFRPEWLEELCKISHRGYTTGFLFGQPQDVGQEYHCAYKRSHLFVGIVEEQLADGRFAVGVRNRLQTGETIELMGPAMRNDSFVLEGMTDSNGAAITAANPNSRVIMALPPGAAVCDLLRVAR
jgi:putative protease